MPAYVLPHMLVPGKDSFQPFGQQQLKRQIERVEERDGRSHRMLPALKGDTRPGPIKVIAWQASLRIRVPGARPRSEHHQPRWTHEPFLGRGKDHIKIPGIYFQWDTADGTHG